MSDKQNIDFSEQELQYISKDNKYEVYFKQKGYNLFKIRSIGALKESDAKSIEKIITNILIKFEDIHPKQKIFFINDVSKLKRPKLDAVNYIFSKIKLYQNLGGILVVGTSPLVKIALTASSHFIKKFVLKFFKTEEEAFEFYNSFLSVNIDYVNKHFNKVDGKYTITFKFNNSTSKFYMEFDGEDIITTKPLGVADAEGISMAFDKFDNEIYPEILNGKRYYRIHDFTNYNTSSGNASTVFIRWVKEHLKDMHLLIFCGLNKKNSAIIKLGRLLFKEKHRILIVDTIEDAYTAIYRHKNNQKIKFEKQIDTEFILPESNEDLKDLVQYLLQENNELKDIITDSSETLFDLFSDMTWPKERLKKLDFSKEKVSEPFENLMDTIEIIYNDLQDLILSRDEEHKKNKLLEERYRKIMQVMPNVAIRGYNKNLEIFFWNDAGKDIFGISSEEAIGQRLNDIYICKNCIELIESAVEKAIINKITGEFLRSGLQILYDDDNKIVVYSIHTSLFDNEGEQIFFSLDFDLTKQYEIEEELRKHKNNLEELVREKTFELEIEKDKAQESDRLKSAFLANMSHEIRSPMNTIIGFSDLLENEDLSTEKRLKFINLIRTSGNNLLHIINDIVDISKIEAGQIGIKKEKFDLCEILESIEKEYSPQFEKIKEIKFNILKCDTEENIILFSDINRIKQILTNLINNAIKFTHKGFIELSYKTTNNKIKIFVKDTGIGLSEEQKEYIFSRFRQADEKISRVYGGTGLGLTISKNLAELLDGNIYVESELDKGSSFILELPFDENIDIDQIEKEESEYNNIIDINQKKILIVEDDMSSALFLKELLENSGIEVIHCNRGTDALKIFEKQKDIDLILLDIQLPDIDGYDITQQIRKTNKKIPIIAQTAFAMLNEREQILNSGFNDYLSKPIKKDVLFKLLEQYLIKRNQL